MKRGQITIFIIIGLVLATAAIGIFFVFSNSDSPVPIQEPLTGPVGQYIQHCVDEATTAGVQLVSQQGGYIELPEYLEYSDPTKLGYVPPNPQATFKIPLWTYKGRSFVPTDEEVRQNIERFVEEQATQCIGDLSQFEQFNVEVLEPMEVDVSINAVDVTTKVYYPIELEQNGQRSTIEQAESQVVIRLKDMLSLSRDIHNLQQEGILENLTIEMIATAKGGGDGIPKFPFEGYEISCQQDIWHIDYDLIPGLQRLVKQNMRFLSFDGTTKYYSDNDPLNEPRTIDICEEINDIGICTRTREEQGFTFDYFENAFTYELENNRAYEELQVRPNYDRGFGMEMDVFPSRSRTTQGIKIDIPLIASCIRHYKHAYSIWYPFMFQVVDDYGNTFNFAEEVSIYKNQAKKNTRASFLAQDDYAYEVTNDNFAASAIHPKVVYVKDGESGEFIEGADVTYDCVQFRYEAGQTARPTFDNVAIAGTQPLIDTTFPSCVNGFLTASKEGYLQASQQVTIDENSGEIQPLQLTPLVTLTPEIYIIEDAGTVQLRSLPEGQSAFISLYNEGYDYEASSLYPTNNVTGDLELILGDLAWNIDVRILSEEGMIGGFAMENVEFTRAQLDGANTLRFYVQTTSNPDPEQFKTFWENTIVAKSPLYPPSLR